LEEVLLVLLLLLSNGGLGFHILLLQDLLVMLHNHIIDVIFGYGNVELVTHHLLGITLALTGTITAPPEDTPIEPSRVDHLILVAHLQGTHTTRAQ
jgi:hypothetical protein